MLRFVVLRHEIDPELARESLGPEESLRGRESHWDLMLEDDGQLLTWAIPQLPLDSEADEEPILCQELDAHRIAYLDYEGPISGGRGEVKRWDQGTFLWKQRRPNELVVILNGEKLRGTLTLIRNSKAPTATAAWMCGFKSEP